MSDKIESKEIKESTEEIIKEEIKEKIIEENKEVENEKVNEEVLEKNNVENVEKEEKVFKKEEVIENKKENKKTVIGIVISAIILLIIAFFCIVFSLLNINNSKIMTGINISGINISDLTKEEAIDYINEKVNDKIAKALTLKYNEEYETTINWEQIEANYKVEEAVEKAYQIGRTGNILKDNYEIFLALIGQKNVDLEVGINDELFNQIIDDISTKIPGAVVQSSYYIEGNELIVKRGTKGITLSDDFTNKLRNAIKIDNNENILLIEVEEANPDEIDIEKIYKEVHTEPKDAYYESNPFKIYPHVDGVDFAITIDEAKSLLLEEKEEYIIPLTISTPKVTTNELGTGAFPDLLSTFSTNYYVANVNRTTNLELSAKKVNGTVLAPGEVFSYNKVVGERTIAAGFKNAAVFENGQVVDGLGGGICQISSTLYNSVLLANLEIVSRRNHGFLTSYLKAGLDATVVYGTTDFQFKNNRNYPIKIVASVKGGVAKIDIYGVKEDTDYRVVIQSNVLSTTPYKTKYIDDPTLEVGKEVVEQAGTNGCKSITYKLLYKGGDLVSKTTISTDTYGAMQRIVRRGTKQITQTIATPIPTVAPTPVPTVKPTPIITVTPKVTPTATPKPTVAPTPTPTVTPSVKPTITPTVTVTPTATAVIQ